MTDEKQIAEWREQIKVKERAANGLRSRVKRINKEIANLVHKIELLESGGIPSWSQTKCNKGG